MSPEELLSLGFSKELVVLFIAALPVLELRGAIPIAINVLGLPWYYALSLALLGNLIPVPFLLLSLKTITKWLSRIAFFHRPLNWLFERTKRRGRIIDRYKRIGLAMFVAIPLPATGAWTGSLAAILFGLEFKHAFSAILAGVIVAGIIITCLSILGWIGAIIASITLISLAITGLWRFPE
ncbi:COG2426 family protein [Chloroflexota bacterium]